LRVPIHNEPWATLAFIRRGEWCIFRSTTLERCMRVVYRSRRIGYSEDALVLKCIWA
jgi:hypothetical protein